MLRQCVLLSLFLVGAAETAEKLAKNGRGKQRRLGRRKRWDVELVERSDEGGSARLPPAYHPSFSKDMAACPYAQWYQGDTKLPKHMGDWERNILQDYTHAHATDVEHPDKHPGLVLNGPLANDHNFNTKLGQGNTLAFVGARLKIDPAPTDSPHLPPEFKEGLFKEKGLYPAVVRMSDFGADGSGKQIGRLALKIPCGPHGVSHLEGCVGGESGEINILYTEALDTFPLAGFKEAGIFGKDERTGFVDKVKYAGGLAMWALDGALWDIIKNKDSGKVLRKHYYSQLPYGLGPTAATKFSLEPRDEGKADPKVGRKLDEVIKANKQVLLDSEPAEPDGAVSVKWDFVLHTCGTQTSKFVREEADKSWVEGHKCGEGYTIQKFKVGTLHIPRQNLDNDGFSVPLKNALVGAADAGTAALGELGQKQKDGLHKLFTFHPGQTHADHKPLGNVGKFRLDFYDHHAQHRSCTHQKDFRADAADTAAVECSCNIAKCALKYPHECEAKTCIQEYTQEQPGGSLPQAYFDMPFSKIVTDKELICKFGWKVWEREPQDENCE